MIQVPFVAVRDYGLIWDFLASWEEFNRFLDRGLVVGSLSSRSIGSLQCLRIANP